ncbi:hypothetical protein Slin15195_G109730 [Septoria linicola]|uniref:Transmembrane protein n=1 Tax=Septoria linicola TaxID=215465 RepID=A0A9Q9AYT3_9PEZI|nr:hypothetical protein Slin14017_G108080 [Septoria linicola]USW57654.1 hypothetical protein Slin15195_G109730 [Septoria linicola]
MSFGSSFEKKFNEDMHDEGQPGRAPAEEEDADMAMKKKGRASPHLGIDVQEFHDKKDQPPRFSTLFGAKASTPPSHPQPPRTPREYVREHYPEPRRKSGIYMPLPLFILLVAVIFFESTIIFAYTIIGLYNNAPSRLFPWAGQGTAAVSSTSCDCLGLTPAQQQQQQQPPAINIAPNFVLPQGHPDAVTELITITATPSISSSTSTSTSTSSSSSSSSSTPNPSSAAAAMASDIASLLGGLNKSPSATTTSAGIALVTVGPEQSTVTSVKMVTKDASGNVISPGPTPTVTQTTFVDPPSGTGAAETSAEVGEGQEPIVIRPTTVGSG